MYGWYNWNMGYTFSDGEWDTTEELIVSAKVCGSSIILFERVNYIRSMVRFEVAIQNPCPAYDAMY